MPKEAKKYKTKDFYLAAFFLANGIEFEVADAGNNTKYFVFTDFQDRDVLIGSFYKSDLIQKYITAIKTAKRRMYATAPPVVYEREEKVRKIK